MKLWVAMELSLVLKLALMVMSAVRESDSHPLRTDPMELKELLAMIGAAGEEGMLEELQEQEQQQEVYPGEEGLLLPRGEVLRRRELPRLGVSIFRSGPSKVTESRLGYKDSGKCRASYLHQ